MASNSLPFLVMARRDAARPLPKSWARSSAIKLRAWANCSNSLSRLKASRAFDSAALASRKALSTALCAGPSCSRMPMSTSPFVCTDWRMRFLQFRSSSAACLQPLELLGTTSKTVSRFRWRSPAAVSKAPPDSLTIFNDA